MDLESHGSRVRTRGPSASDLFIELKPVDGTSLLNPMSQEAEAFLKRHRLTSDGLLPMHGISFREGVLEAGRDGRGTGCREMDRRRGGTRFWRSNPILRRDSSSPPIRRPWTDLASGRSDMGAFPPHPARRAGTPRTAVQWTSHPKHVSRDAYRLSGRPVLSRPPPFQSTGDLMPHRSCFPGIIGSLALLPRVLRRDALHRPPRTRGKGNDAHPDLPGRRGGPGGDRPRALRGADPRGRVRGRFPHFALEPRGPRGAPMSSAPVVRTIPGPRSNVSKPQPTDWPDFAILWLEGELGRQPRWEDLDRALHGPLREAPQEPGSRVVGPTLRRWAVLRRENGPADPLARRDRSWPVPRSYRHCC